MSALLCVADSSVTVSVTAGHGWSRALSPKGFQCLGPCPCCNANLGDEFAESVAHLYLVCGHRDQPLCFEDLALFFIILNSLPDLGFCFEIQKHLIQALFIWESQKALP